MFDMSNEETWEEVVERPLPRVTMEEPIVGRTWILENRNVRQPETEIQALMETAPFQEPAVSKEELQNGMSALMDMMMSILTEEEKAVIETTVIAGHSIRNAAEILGMPKSVVHRLKQSALRTIREQVAEYEI